MKKITLILTILTLSLFCGSAQNVKTVMGVDNTAGGGLTLVDSNTSVGVVDYKNVGDIAMSDEYRAGVFQASASETIVAVEVYLSRVNGPTTYRIELWSYDTMADEPDALISSSGDVNVSAVSAWPTYDWVQGTVSASLTSGTKYCVVVRITGSVTGSDYVRWSDASYPGGDPGHSTMWRSPDGSTWTQEDVANLNTFKFKTYK